MPRPTSRSVAKARVVDLAVALPALAVLSPLWITRGIAALIGGGRLFDSTVLCGRHAERFLLRDFAGSWPGATLARWFNVAAGHLSVGGPAAATPASLATALRDRPESFLVRPGLVTIGEVRRRVGIGGTGEIEVEREFVNGYGTFSALALATRGLLARLLVGRQDRAPSPRLDLLGVSLDNTSMGEAVAWLIGRAADGHRTNAYFANPDCLNIAFRDGRYRRALATADRVFADGIGLRMAAGLTGQRMADNVNGTDMFPLLCAAAAAASQPLYLLGGRPGLAEATARFARENYPGLVVAGARDGYFESGDEAAVVDEINRSGARILLVGLGAPRQELWLQSVADRVELPVRLGVGGLYDYFSGRIPRAPVWLRELGFEWAWRLGCEPGRLWRRYLVGNPIFLARVLASRWRQRKRARTAHAIELQGPLGRQAANARLALLKRSPEIRQAAGRVGKRLLDTGAAAIGIAILSPLLLTIAIAIKLESRGPVIFRQKRVGRDGHAFMMLKFRSMFVDAEQRLESLLKHNEMNGGVIFKMRDDPRVTRIGRFIRRTSLDELPQLFNVLRGDMSLVGPRPPLPREVELYSFHDRGRLGAVPGITCIWQVSGRSEIPFDRQVEMDLDYIHRQSMAEDLKLLFRTVPALLFGRGAY